MCRDVFLSQLLSLVSTQLLLGEYTLSMELSLPSFPSFLSGGTQIPTWRGMGMYMESWHQEGALACETFSLPWRHMWPWLGSFLATAPLAESCKPSSSAAAPALCVFLVQ